MCEETPKSYQGDIRNAPMLPNWSSMRSADMNELETMFSLT